MRWRRRARSVGGSGGGKRVCRSGGGGGGSGVARPFGDGGRTAGGRPFADASLGLGMGTVAAVAATPMAAAGAMAWAAASLEENVAEVAVWAERSMSSGIRISAASCSSPTVKLAAPPCALRRLLQRGVRADRGWRAHCQSRLFHRASTRCTTAVHSTGVGGAAQLEEADGAHTRRGWHGRGLDRIVWLVRSECRQRNIIAPVGRALGRPLYIDCNCLNSKVLSQLGLDDSHHVHHALRQWYRHRRLVEPWYPAGYV